MKLFAEKGFDRTTIDDIAEACGIAPGLIYHYFDSKLAILHTILERSAFLSTMTETLSNPPKATVESALTELAHAYWKMLEAKQDFALMMMGEMQRNPEVAALVGKMIRTGVRLLSNYLREQIKLGNLREDLDPEIFVRTLWGALFQSFFAHCRLAPYVRRIPPKRLIEDIVRLLLYGAIAQKPAKGKGGRK